MAPPRKKAKNGESMEPQTGIAPSGFIRFTEDIWAHSESVSGEAEVLGSRWKLVVKKSASSHLGVYLQRSSYATRPWSVDVSAQFKLVGTKGNREFEFKKTFHDGLTRAGVDDVIEWNDVEDREKGFIYNNNRWIKKIIVEARFELSNFVGISPAIDFTDSEDPRHDVSFLLNGGRLFANKQILAVHSPVFAAMFFGNFSEKDKKEIELKDVNRQDFHVALKTLYNPSYVIAEDLRLLNSLVIIANLYDIKMILERVEEVIINRKTISMAQAYLFVDKHDSSRFIKLNARAFDNFLAHGGPVDDNDCRHSDEYHQLSGEAKSACNRIFRMLPDDDAMCFPYWHRSTDPCTKMKEVENMMETKDLVASGCFPSVFNMGQEDGILSCSQSHRTVANDIGGLMWALDVVVCEFDRHREDGAKRYSFSMRLVANEDRPSKFEWEAEGIMEVEVTFLTKGVVLMDQSDPTYSTELVDEKGERVNPHSTNPYPVKKQFAFTVNSSYLKAMSPCVCVVKNEDYEEDYRMEDAVSVKTRIHLTKVTGVRTIPKFDFTVPLSSSDAILIVEGKELHVHKEYLSNISSVFRTMFNEKSSGDHNRYELKGVEYQDCVSFLQWIYPSSVKNFEEDGMSRMVVLAKRFDVPFIFDQIIKFLRSVDFYVGLKIILNFGYDTKIPVSSEIDLKSIYQSIENTRAYKAMDDGKARKMLEWMIKTWSKP